MIFLTGLDASRSIIIIIIIIMQDCDRSVVSFIIISLMKKTNKQTTGKLQGWAHVGLLWDALGRSRDGFIVSFVRGLKGLTS